MSNEDTNYFGGNSVSNQPKEATPQTTILNKEGSKGRLQYLLKFDYNTFNRIPAQKWFNKKIPLKLSVNLLNILELIRTAEIQTELRNGSNSVVSRNANNKSRNNLLQVIIEIDKQMSNKCSLEDLVEEYLKTLQPFMLQEIVLLQDPKYYGCLAYIFRYLIGLHGIYIKIVKEPDTVNVITVSFHSMDKLSDGKQQFEFTKIWKATSLSQSNNVVCLDYPKYLAFGQINLDLSSLRSEAIEITSKLMQSNNLEMYEVPYIEYVANYNRIVSEYLAGNTGIFENINQLNNLDCKAGIVFLITTSEKD